ncbi:MAG: PEP-CTERM sorting domain-containing protein [Fimbriimonadales bacterium]
MNTKPIVAVCLAVAGSAAVRADIFTTTPLQVGGFYDTGGLDNHIEHQNYYVGYGTVGGVRSTERRSFFWYHIPEFSGPVLDVSIKLKMLVTTSLIFGISPGDPMVHDTLETFRLGATPIDPLTIVDPDLTPTEADAIFETFDDHPIAPAKDFIAGSIPDFPFAVEIHLDDVGKGLVSSHRGADVVFTGWMPTWSEDLRTDGMGHFLEGDELLFGFSDIPHLVPAPELTIVTPVPEPCTLVAMALGVGFVSRKRRRQTAVN